MTAFQSSSLPIAAVLDALEQALVEHRRVVLEAPPGAGKSTYLPLWLLRRGVDRQHRVVLLQPRRLAADNVARFLAHQLGERLGERVGLRTRFDHCVSANTVIEVMTEGIFLRRIQRDPELSDTAYVLFDEFHERSWAADLALAFARESQTVWREGGEPLHLVVMSATLPALPLADWLQAPVVRTAGRGFPVDVRYQPAGRRDWAEHAAAQIDTALAGGARKVLVFLSGWGAMQRLQKTLGERDDRDVFLLHSRVPPDRQQLALAEPGDRPAVVLATNIAETSLTIAGVDAVIDTGQVRRPLYDSRRGMDRLETGWISQASAAQRAGRAGRLGPGVCIRLWSQEQQGRLRADDPAEIQQVDLVPLALELALWASPDLLLLEEPPVSRLTEARQLLQRLGALDAGGGITVAGRAMAELGLHPRLGHLVLCGREHGRLQAACQLAALLSEGDFLRAEEGVAADLDWRLELLRRREDSAGGRVQSGARQRVLQLSRQLLQRSGGGEDAQQASAGAGELLLAAFPDRLARQRAPGSVRYLTVDGFEVALHEADALRREPWLVIAEHDGDPRGARVRLAAALPEAEALMAGQVRSAVVADWDEERQALGARRERRLGAIVLEARNIPLEEDQAGALWLQMLRARGLDWLQWPAAARAWLGRVRWLARRREDWPDWSEAALLADLEQWLLPYLGGVRRLEQLRSLDYAALLQARLDYDRRRELDRLAPAQFALPSGREHPVDYSGEGPPRLAARVQEFYGLDRHPAVAGGAEPLLLELLSPAQRPVQVTQDLPGFWRSSYQEVRKDMKGRYPKHFWPERPWEAPATTTTRRRMADPGSQ